jgi:hypothetical protein
MVIYGYRCLHMIIDGERWLYMVICSIIVIAIIYHYE